MSRLLPTPPSAIRYLKLAKEETLFRQGDQTVAVFAVKQGRVRLVRHLSDGSTVPIYVSHSGNTFSEAALFSPTYHCDAIADMDSEIEIHSKEALSQALYQDPKAAWAFMSHLAKQVITLRSRLEVRNIRSAPERVIYFLKLETNEKAMEVTFVRPLKDIAADIGLTHETFYRVLSKLEADGTIKRNGRTITLLD